MEDINLLLSYIETEILNGKKQVFSNAVAVNGALLLNLVSRIRAELPNVTGAARVEQARRDANEIMENAEMRLEEMFDNDKFIREKKAYAEQIIADAISTQNAVNDATARNAENVIQRAKDGLNDAINRLNDVVKYIRSEK